MTLDEKTLHIEAQRKALYDAADAAKLSIVAGDLRRIVYWLDKAGFEIVKKSES